MKYLGLYSFLLVFGLLLAGCGSNGDKPVPRRDAYPRIAEYAAEYVAVDSLPVNFEANAGAVVSVENSENGRNYWATLSYPAYSAKIYLTFAPVDASSLPSAAENRMERIRLNLNGAPFNVEEVENEHGFYAMVIDAPSALATPVQFITTDESEGNEIGWLVSGAVGFDALPDGAPRDSLAPMVAVLKRDLIHALRTMTK